jgi:hypothetical protein
MAASGLPERAGRDKNTLLARGSKFLNSDVISVIYAFLCDMFWSFLVHKIRVASPDIRMLD